jgi:hypothetical protein
MMPFAETSRIMRLLDYKDEWRSTTNFFSTRNGSKWDCEQLVALKLLYRRFEISLKVSQNSAESFSLGMAPPLSV